MKEVDAWTLDEIVQTLIDACHQYAEDPAESRQETFNKVVADVQQAIREKILGSYRNGQRDCPKCNSEPERKSGYQKRS